MNDNLDLAKENGLNLSSMGGTELMYRSLYEKLPRELLKKFQIFPSRINVPLDSDRVRLLWIHDMYGDPMYDHLKNGGYNKFHKLIFVSNYQMNLFIQAYQIPWSKCLVLQNAIESIKPNQDRENNKIQLAYWSTPRRGLAILVPVFQKLCETHKNIHLTVISSFKLYGWDDGADEPYKPLFEACKNDKNISYFGSLSQEETRSLVAQSDILAYPNTWNETSCRVLMESMSAGLLAVISNLGALPETSANFANLYQFDEDINRHASLFYSVLDVSIQSIRSEAIKKRLELQKLYADIYYTWPKRVVEWKSLLMALQNEPTKFEETKSYFEYKVQ